MTGQKIFISCLFTLIVFNILFYLTGYNSSLLSVNAIIGTFISMGIIAVIVSALPFIDSESTMKWFMSVVIMLSIMYSLSFDVLTYHITIGAGLATNLTNMFSSSTTQLSFMAWLFFNALGLIGVIGGVFSMSGGE